jgi:hypothetical protein
MVKSKLILYDLIENSIGVVVVIIGRVGYTKLYPLIGVESSFKSVTLTFVFIGALGIYVSVSA